MDYRYTAVFATISNSFSDAVLDYAVNRYNYHKVLLYTSFIAFVIQLLYGLNTGIMFTYASVPYLLVHGVFVLLGYICFVKSLEYLPLGLVGLIESSIYTGISPFSIQYSTSFTLRCHLLDTSLR